MGKELERCIEIIAQLRGENGCPWDREQTHASLLKCLLDEVYEFLEAVEHKDTEKMKEELGDILLQVVLHCQIAKETGSFDIEDVASGINEKIIRRHPHVFGQINVCSSKEVVRNWEEIKHAERSVRGQFSSLDDIPKAMPALLKAEKVQRRASQVGFDWNTIEPVLDKVEEEFGEFRTALKKNMQLDAQEELGDILFALVNVARHSNICAEDALRSTINKFIHRFRYIEQRCRESGKDMKSSSLEEMDMYWEECKEKQR